MARSGRVVGADSRPTRPWLTVMDDFSRAVCRYTVSTGALSAIGIAVALRQAIWRKAGQVGRGSFRVG